VDAEAATDGRAEGVSDLLRSASDLAAAYRSGDAAPEEIVEITIERLDGAHELGAIQWRDDERIRLAAKHAAERFASGIARPLEGIPWTAKELLPVAGIAGLHAMAPFAATVPPGSAWLVETLDALGAILVARTSSPELGALSTTENHRGPCRNPHDPMRSSGGSSGGAAVCAALGVAPFNHGSDAGGSIRIPASCCDVVGLKPTRGRISRGPFRGDGWAGLSVEGPLTPTVADAAWFLDLTHGARNGDTSSPPPPRTSFLAALEDERPKRIAVAVTRDGLGVTPAAEAAVRAAADALANLGHEIVEDAPPGIELLQPAFGSASIAGIGSMPLTSEQVATLLPRVRKLWEDGQAVAAVDLLRDLDSGQRQTRVIAAWFEGVDALLTPTLSSAAPLQSEILGAEWDLVKIYLQWTWPFNVTGQPALSVPFGADGGLPIGVQLVGSYADEATVLALGAQLERVR
jgi:amidase